MSRITNAMFASFLKKQTQETMSFERETIVFNSQFIKFKTIHKIIKMSP